MGYGPKNNPLNFGADADKKAGSRNFNLAEICSLLTAILVQTETGWKWRLNQISEMTTAESFVINYHFYVVLLDTCSLRLNRAGAAHWDTAVVTVDSSLK